MTEAGDDRPPIVALVVTVPASEAELASDALWALGVTAVEERGAEEGTEDHFVELWTSLGDEVAAITAAADAFPARWRWRTVDVDAASSETWRAHAVPSWIADDFAVVPAWLDVEVGDGVTRIDIEPGSTFGLGDHPSTVLALRLLREAWFQGATVLDVGAGSGVLSVAAARIGAPYVEAIDLSPAAVTATLDNARRNGVEGQVVASTTALADIEGPFDIVVANLLAPPLLQLASELARVVSTSGALAISGVLEGAHDHVLEALRPLRPVKTLTRERWAAVLLRH